MLVYIFENSEFVVEAAIGSIILHILGIDLGHFVNKFYTWCSLRNKHGLENE